jgi:methylase of polypeptide subunit release factors
MAEESAQTVVAGLFDFILPLIPGLEENLMSGISVLDIGCGSGHAINTMAARFPRSKFVGYDISEEAVNNARSYYNIVISLPIIKNKPITPY